MNDSRAMLVVFTFSCAIMGVAVASQDRGDNMYYKSRAEAEADLDLFERDYPKCMLWTNWQKMCSRTGRNSKIHCAEDRERRVRPSAPFCAHYINSDYGRNKPDQVASILRFCKSKHIAGQLSEDGVKFQVTECRRYSPARPFNGKRLSARLNPLCATWTTQNNGILKCTRVVAADATCIFNDGTPREQDRRGIWFGDQLPRDKWPVFGAYCE